MMNFVHEGFLNVTNPSTDCIIVNECADRCACAIQNHNEINLSCSMRNAWVDYQVIYYCHLEGLSKLTVSFLIIWLFALYYLLVTTAEHYFFPTLSQLSKRLRLATPIAGVTLLAFSNASPDVFAALSGLTHNLANIAIPALLGAGLFVTSAVVAAVMLFSPPASLPKLPYIRDVLFYTFTVAIFFGITIDGKIHLYESTTFVALYVLYITAIFLARYIDQRSKRKRREEIGIVEDDSITYFGTMNNIQNEDEIVDATLPALEDILLIAGVRSQTTSQKYYHGGVEDYTYESTRSLLSQPENNTKSIVDTSSSQEEEDDEVQDNIEEVTPDQSQNWQNKKKKKISLSKRIVNTWYSLLALVSWHEMGIRQRVLYILFLPFNIARSLTIPPAGVMGVGGWSRTHAVIFPLCTLLFLLASTGYFTRDVFEIKGFEVPAWLIFLSAGVLIGLIVLLTTKRREFPPTWYYLVFVFGGFINASVWMYVLATELLAVVRTLGEIWGIDEGLLGLTVVAWVTSSVDLVANLVIGKSGFPDMAISACFGAPALSLLISVGVGVTYVNIINYPIPYSLQLTPYLYFCFIFLAGVLLTNITFTSVNKFKTSKWLGASLIALYLCFSVLSILNESGVGFLNWKSS